MIAVMKRPSVGKAIHNIKMYVDLSLKAVPQIVKRLKRNNTDENIMSAITHSQPSIFCIRLDVRLPSQSWIMMVKATLGRQYNIIMKTLWLYHDIEYPVALSSRPVRYESSKLNTRVTI